MMESSFDAQIPQPPRRLQIVLPAFFKKWQQLLPRPELQGAVRLHGEICSLPVVLSNAVIW